MSGADHRVMTAGVRHATTGGDRRAANSAGPRAMTVVDRRATIAEDRPEKIRADRRGATIRANHHEDSTTANRGRGDLLNQLHPAAGAHLRTRRAAVLHLRQRAAGVREYCVTQNVFLLEVDVRGEDTAGHVSARAG